MCTIFIFAREKWQNRAVHNACHVIFVKLIIFHKREREERKENSEIKFKRETFQSETAGMQKKTLQYIKQFQ